MAGLLAGRYRLEERLGAGGMGEAWAAWDAEMQRRVAVKTMHSRGGTSDARVLFREARTAGRLSHPGIVTVHDIALDSDGRRFLVMELIDGRDLGKVLETDGPFSVDTALDRAAQVADALGAAHAAGVVHRDLKPSNLMLTAAGTVKILDFGIAGFLDSAHTLSEPVGSWPYMAPERIDGGSGDGRTDLYALGCVIHELLTGSPPFGDLSGYALLTAHKETVPEPLGTLRADLPAGLGELVAELLAKDPGERPARAEEVRDRLRLLAAGAPPVPAPHPDGQAPPTTRPRHDATTVTGPRAPEPVLAPTVPAPPATPTRPAGPGAGPTRRPPRRRRALIATAALIACAVAAALLLLRSGDGRTLWSAESVSTRGVAAGGTVFLTGAEDGTVEARDVRTGDLRWTYRTGGDVADPRASADGTLYVAAAGGAVHAVDTRTGRRRWAVPGPEGARDHGELTASAGRVYVVTGADTRALDARSGKTLWHALPGVPGTLAATADTVYVSATTDDHDEEYGKEDAKEDAKVFALDAATGRTRWTHSTSEPIVGAPLAHGDTVYVGSWDDRMYALDARTGTPEWTYEAGDAIGTTPAFADGLLYLTTQNGTLAALDARSGDVVWHHEVSGYGEVGESPAVADGIVYTADAGTDRISAFDARSGKEKWHHTIEDTEAFSAPVLVDGVLLVSGKDDVEDVPTVLHALDTRP
ncbi:protein kinase domain-containing protein [Streptomyces sp. NPDC001732]